MSQVMNDSGWGDSYDPYSDFTEGYGIINDVIGSRGLNGDGWGHGKGYGILIHGGLTGFGDGFTYGNLGGSGRGDGHGYGDQHGSSVDHFCFDMGIE